MNEETKIQLEFDHQMIEDKDKEIERLYEEKKSLKLQIDNVERVDRDEKVEKNERDSKTKK